MDLNIGTAFWFASRGIGTLRQYSAEEYQQMYDFEENGRPLLRLGEEGARRGKGQKEKNISSEKNDSEIKKKLFCSRERCRKVSKVGCLNQFCRTCCEKYQQAAAEARTGEGEEAGREVSQESSACPAHRLKKKMDDSTALESEPDLTRGQDLKAVLPPSERYRSTCKILLVGIGADEQMAGYGRHRTTFEKLGWDGLVKELDSDMTRLWTRNLGR
jgi:hypothetical protein